ncbi:hypothetical protein X801_02583 [Opisthorchis viverrini]|uniref:Uncharacterized protein n=1 Tax=Opisthorchis viverrini TaxID=6198 RepID=A0A1S8X4F1_OPIVI|nr:hypothetical protein X801_02583 [Opisthorchis viverrini]
MGIWNQRGGNLFALNRHNLLLKFLLETPNVVEVEVDSRRQLDGQLKQMCEKFIDETVVRLCGELPSFLDRANAVLAAPGARLSDQTFASASEVKELVSSAHRALLSAFGRGGRSKQQAPEGSGSTGFHLLHYLNIYLANPDTEGILLRRIQAGVLQHWRSIHQLLSEHYTDEDRMIIACPTESQAPQTACLTVRFGRRAKSQHSALTENPMNRYSNGRFPEFYAEVGQRMRARFSMFQRP